MSKLREVGVRRFVVVVAETKPLIKQLVSNIPLRRW